MTGNSQDDQVKWPPMPIICVGGDNQNGSFNSSMVCISPTAGVVDDSDDDSPKRIRRMACTCPNCTDPSGRLACMGVV